MPPHCGGNRLWLPVNAASLLRFGRIVASCNIWLSLEPFCQGTGAAPRPFLRSRTQSRLHRIVCHISTQPGPFFVILNHVVVCLLLPKMTADTAKHFVRLAGSKGFPTVFDATQGMSRSGPDHDMHMVRHDRPCVQVVTFTIKEVQRPGHQICYFRPSQPALTRPGIKKRLHPLRIPNEQLLLLLPCQRTFGCHGVLDDGFALVLQLEHGFTRQRIRKTESYEIRRAFTLQVRQLAPKMEPGNQPARIGIRSGRLHYAVCISQTPPIANPDDRFAEGGPILGCGLNWRQDAALTGTLEACRHTVEATIPGCQ